MNKEQIYVEFRKKVESDDKYFTFGRYGIIEETLRLLLAKSRYQKLIQYYRHQAWYLFLCL